MTAVAAETIAIPPDPVLDGARGLFADAGHEAVEAFLESRSWEVQAMRPVQALYRPGVSCTVRYRVRGRNRAGQSRVVDVTAETRATARKLLTPGADFENRYGLPDPVEPRDPYVVWAFPYDPALRGLEDAAWGPAVRAAMQHREPRPRAVVVDPLRYRPTRRAVFRYRQIYGGSIPSRILYAKVLRTLRARASAELAEMLRRPVGILRRQPKPPVYLALPVERINDNVLLFDPMEGRPLRDLLLADASLPEPRRVVELMQSLQKLAPRVGQTESIRHSRSTETNLDASVRLLAQLLPDMAAEVQGVADDIRRAAEHGSISPAVVHGDFYDAQVLVREDFSLGVVDVDDLGIGDPALDAANFTTHLLALALTRSASKSRLLAYRSLARDAFMEAFGIAPSELAWREALVMMQLAPGPFRVLEPNWPERLTEHVRVAQRLLDHKRA